MKHVKRDIGDDFLELLKELRKIIDKVIDDAIAKLPDLKNRIEEIAQDILDEVENTTHDIVDAGFVLIDELKKQAAENGIDIDSCLNDNEQIIHDTAQSIVSSTSSCINYNIATVDTLLQKTIAQIEARRELIRNLADEFEACNDNACRLGVLVKAEQLLANLPNDLNQLLENVLETIETIQLDVENCLAKSSAEVASKLQPLVDDVVQCIKDKLQVNKVRNLF